MKMLFCWCNCQSDLFVYDLDATHLSKSSKMWTKQCSMFILRFWMIVHYFYLFFFSFFCHGCQSAIEMGYQSRISNTFNTMCRHFIIMENYLAWLIGFIIDWKWQSFCLRMTKQREGEKNPLKLVLLAGCWNETERNNNTKTLISYFILFFFVQFYAHF